ncbi:MAG: ribbon-helix-helix protein, CopG family [Opitutales bacterium]|nr:ribbon-helix-helix protein, CopG family [Opitutales bacterium]
MDENPPFASSSRRAPEQAQISISISRELLARIDSAAQAENRNRSNFISTHLERLLANVDESGKIKKKKKKKDRGD